VVSNSAPAREVAHSPALPKAKSQQPVLRYHSPVAKGPKQFEVTCPCCSAVLKVDSATASVIAHTAPLRPKTFADMEAAARAMKEQDARKESIFRQSVEAEKNKADLLEKKFQEAVKRAKEAPDIPRVRDIDLD
jgi:hypothetical protein